MNGARVGGASLAAFLILSTPPDPIETPILYCHVTNVTNLFTFRGDQVMQRDHAYDVAGNAEMRALIGEALVIEWAAKTNELYTIEHTTNFVGWGFAMRAVVTSNSTIRTFWELDGTRRFYRVRATAL